ncbi:CobW family GTP-binding protein [Halopseudomonas pelagia]|uniref:CobW family GTP-binding protein n=1 Tax=Halopseudomonas pelagia TaxID=553151 RepID=UPI00048C2B8C|nr:GTP-binding protein [Halopseudomonas pelagia]
MIQDIPTHLIAGPLGAGKTTLLKQLMRQRPPHERWAILINEFGQIGIDAALLQQDAEGVALAEVPGGCLCCVNGVPFQVGLNRLLRKGRPTRLFIETSGLGHPLQLLQQLSAPPWLGILNLQPLVMVLDANKMAQGTPLPEAQQLALPQAGLLLLNKSARLDSTAKQTLEARLPTCDKLWCEQADIRLDSLPLRQAQVTHTHTAMPPASSVPTLPPLWRSTADWHCHSQAAGEHHSIGWQIHPDQVFDLAALQTWLLTHPWLRAKGVVRSAEGWRSFNALPAEPIRWQRSDWQQDNRIELITAQRPDRLVLEQGLRAVINSD